MGVCWLVVSFFPDSGVPGESSEQSQVKEIWHYGDPASGFKDKNMKKKVMERNGS